MVRVREMVLSKTQGRLRDRTYAERLYPPERLCTALREAGPVNLKVHRRAQVVIVLVAVRVAGAGTNQAPPRTTLCDPSAGPVGCCAGLCW